MKQMLKYLLSAIMLLIVSCGADDPLDSAWAKFEDGDYAGAYTEFNDLTDDPEAYVGLGWTTLKMPGDSSAASDRFFGIAAAASSDTLADAYAGWTIVGWARGDHQASVDRARVVIRQKPSYTFAHDRRVTSGDIKLHEAYGLYHLGSYQASSDLAQELDPGFTGSTDPATLLDELESLFDLFD